MATPSVVVYFEYTTIRVSSDHTSHTFCYFVFVFLKRYFLLLFVVGLVFLFFVAPFSLLAVFNGAAAFNSDVSKWNTGAVTYMNYSKCILFVATSSVVVFLNIHDNSSFI